MSVRGRGRAAAMMVGFATAMVLAGCGSSDSSGDGKPAAKSSPSETPSESATGTKVTVSEKEFSIQLSPSSFSPGTYTFSVKNDGSFPHNLAIAGPGVGTEKSDTVQGGQSTALTVKLQKGTYQLWCAVPTHKEKGMKTSITVS